MDAIFHMSLPKSILVKKMASRVNLISTSLNLNTRFSNRPDLIEEIENQFKAGFLNREVLIDECFDWAADSADDEGEEVEELHIREECTKFIDDMFQKEKEESKNWPEVTDNDRLDAAYKKLNRIGIVARQYFTDCGTCANSSIKDEIEEESDSDKEVIGVSWYIEPAGHDAANGGDLMVAYGSTESREKDDEIGQMIVDVLEEHGLKVYRDKSIIYVHVDWKRNKRERDGLFL